MIDRNMFLSVFSLYHNPEHSKLVYKKSIVPLKEKEYWSSYLFADPNIADQSHQRLGALKLAQSSISRENVTPTIDAAI